jgi:putative phosphoribosyl transferase
MAPILRTEGNDVFAGTGKRRRPMRADSFAIFHDRHDAGRQLAQALERYAGRGEVIVLALPRGGVPVGYEVARALHVPLDVYLVRKLGVPGRPELAMGAIAMGGGRVLNEDVIEALAIPEQVIDAVAAAETYEIERRDRLYRGDRPPPAVRGQTVIVVDDGLATGATMRAAIAALREQTPARIVVAVPTAARETCNELRREADEVICLTTPSPFLAVGAWYADFSATEDDEVRDLLTHMQHIPLGATQECVERMDA